MKPTRLWIGLIFIALGVFGVLDAAGVWQWDSTVGTWWPVAIIGFGIADMLGDQRVTTGGVVISGIGLALLVDELNWAGDDVIWSVLLLLIGGAILFGGWKRRGIDRTSPGLPTTTISQQPVGSGQS